jgi:hypothetical protein
MTEYGTRRTPRADPAEAHLHASLFKPGNFFTSHTFHCREKTIRTGLFERDRFDAVYAQLPKALRLVVELESVTGGLATPRSSRWSAGSRFQSSEIRQHAERLRLRKVGRVQSRRFSFR